MKNIAILFGLLQLVVVTCSAQDYSLSGKVIDAGTGASLPFVNLIVKGHPQIGTTADIDGRFTISAFFPITSLSFTYVGYRDTTVTIKSSDEKNNLLIKLTVVRYKLGEVTIRPGINPAMRIIRRAVLNKDSNNPEKVRSFTYDSYNKLYCTADMKNTDDTANSLDLTNRIHTVFDTVKKHHSMRRLLKRQYLFLMESVSKRKFMYPDRNYEQVVASRTSGLKESPFALLATQMQSFSFYPDEINILGMDYLNPVSNPGMKRYYFAIEDTLYSGKDTVFVISFNPKTGRDFNGIKGVVYINTNKYAVQNVIAHPIREDQTISINIQQKYEFVPPTPNMGGKGQWFPVQLNTDWVYNNSLLNDSDIVITNGTVNPDDDYNKLKVVTRTYIKNIVLDTLLRKRDFGRVEVELTDSASHRSEAFWAKYRNDSLSAKEKRTYRKIDSIGKAEHFDRKLKWFETLSSGELKVGLINFDLNKIITYNGYEKFRLGLGLHTNDAVSKFVSVGGYGAYGFGDKAFKYGGDVGFIFNPYAHFKLDFAYQLDVIGAGSVSFYNDQSLLSTESYYSYFINNMDKMQKETVSLSFDALKYFQFNFFGDEQLRTVTNSYEYGVSNETLTFLSNQFWFTEAGVGFRYSYKEKYIKSPLDMISLGTKYPVIWGNITHGFNDILNGGFDYTKYDLKISKDVHIPLAGYSSFEVLTGYVQGNVPYTLLYNGKGSYEQFTLAVDNSFETMRLNEFLSSKYVDLFYFHNFQSFLYKSKKFNPELKIVSHAGWGILDNPANHYFITYKTMDKGYYESGLEINNLVKSFFFHLGVGSYYRYGPYSFAKAIDNFAFKFTVTTSLE